MPTSEWLNLATFLKERRLLSLYFSRVKNLKSELVKLRTLIDGGSKYRMLNVSIHPDDVDDPVLFENMANELIGLSDPKKEEKSAKPSRRQFSEWLKDGKNLQSLRKKSQKNSCLYPIWLIWTTKLICVNSSKMDGSQWGARVVIQNGQPTTVTDFDNDGLIGKGPINFDGSCWKSGTSMTGKASGVTGKNFSNVGQFDYRVIDEQIQKTGKRLHELNRKLSEYRRTIRMKLLNSESVNVLNRGSQSPSKQWGEIFQSVMENPHSKHEPYVWVIGLGQSKQVIQWCETCISVAFEGLSKYDEKQQTSFAPMGFDGDDYKCLNGRCHNRKDTSPIGADRVLEIGFDKLRNDDRIIESISIDGQISLSELMDFRRKFGTSVVIDGRINL